MIVTKDKLLDILVYNRSRHDVKFYLTDDEEKFLRCQLGRYREEIAEMIMYDKEENEEKNNFLRN